MAGPERERPEGREVVAIVLAIGLATAVNLLLFGVVYDAVRSDTPGISENATQVIIAAFTGMTGVLGGYVGGRAAERGRQQGVEAERRAEVERRAAAPPEVEHVERPEPEGETWPT